ncbi:uncharacterized protein LOC142236018 [Haematobia irritans]|uniref:uncharacterized protein LOC142236018 n=1 Tax=Haematobia irritans TaxID=7368 RepID=UPI003F508AF2
MTHNYNLGPIASDNSVLKNFSSSFSGNLNIGHVNAQSLSPSNSNAKIEEFKNTFFDSGLDIIGISETWFKPDIFSSSLNMQNYNLVRNDRPDNISGNLHPRRGGGVCLYVSKKLRYRIVYRGKQFGSCESLFIEVFGNNASVIVGIVYLPTGRIDIFEDMHNCLFDRFTNTIVMGDFNVNLFDPTKSSNFRAMTSRYGLECVHNSLPTHLHIHNNSTSLLDLFLVSQPSLIAHKAQLQFPFFCSYHSFIYCSFKFSPTSHETYIEYKDYNRIHFDVLLNYFNQLQISSIFNTNDVDLQLSVLNCVIDDLHSLIPLSRKKANTDDCGWINDRSIKIARRERDVAYGEYLRDRSEGNWKIYCRLRNRAKATIRKARSRHGRAIFGGTDNSLIWKRARELGFVGRDIPDMNADEIESIATTFLDNLVPSNDSSNIDFDEFVENIESFSFRSVSIDELVSAVDAIKSNALGHDAIPISFIKKIFPLISPMLLHIINTIFTVSEFPSKWKIGIMNDDGLMINPAKSKAMHFHTRTRNALCPRIVINNQIVDYVDSLKCLGVMLDPNLNFDVHLNYLSNRICLTLRKLYQLRAYTPRYIRKKLAHALLMSLKFTIKLVILQLSRSS